MRLVLDTNIIVSALFWDGNEKKLLTLCRRRIHQLIISPQMLDELRGVMRDKFKVPQDRLTAYNEEILLMAELVFPSGDVDLVRDDPKDNIVLETAYLGNADALVTGDRHLLKLTVFEGIPIIRTTEI